MAIVSENEPITIVGVSLDEGDDAAQLVVNYAAKSELDWPQCLAGNHPSLDLREHWGITAIPRLFLIDQTGRLVDVDADIPTIQNRVGTASSEHEATTRSDESGNTQTNDAE